MSVSVLALLYAEFRVSGLTSIIDRPGAKKKKREAEGLDRDRPDRAKRRQVSFRTVA